MSAFAAVGVTLGATSLFVLLLGLFRRPGAEGSSSLLTAFGCQAVAYLLTLFLILRRWAPQVSIRALLGFRPTNWAFYPLGIAIGLSVELPSNAVFELIERRFPRGEPDAIAALWADAQGPRRLAIALVLVLLGPLLEEVFFRGALFRPLRAGGSGAKVVALTAVLFGLAHVEWRMVPPIVVVGLALGALRLWSGSLWPSLFGHVAFNALGLFSISSTAAPGAEEPLPLPWILGSLGVALSLLALAWRLGARSTTAAAARGIEGT